MLAGDMIDVWRKGKAVSNPALWKNIGATTSAIAGLAASGLAIARAFGYQLDISSEAINSLAGGIAGLLFLFNSGIHITTSDKVGLPNKCDESSGGKNIFGGVS